ncbi:NAD(P)H-hydrate dehydratase [Luteimonas yindakuii]|uniref:ADP-dependent (S)-NAD(P)H-hydrate dehydratase n=1 Tax=Luteimonas yindakuii TaxID=2565782 RepID=A0A4Z1R230_9GAMM|nr:NAD(P)H-hydrate dehydratase [Luteimonas yindakuii]TKS53582.1 NAD(P)H-hydrate dehydratase [Luteimonas yindakuii]
MNAARRTDEGRASGARRITPALLKAWPLPDPSGGTSKEDRGRVMVIGGSRQIPGAVLLTGIAALRAGAGKLQVATVADAAMSLVMSLPEARVIGRPSDRAGAIRDLDGDATHCVRTAHSVVVGPGMDRSAATQRVVRAVIANAQGTIVLDAGALDALALAAFRRRRSAGVAMVLTPHAGEMAALLDTDEDTVMANAETIAREFAQAWNVVLALKGPTTWIAAADGRMWVNTAGSVGLGTSGSGDVLAGVIAGLAARGATPEQAAVWGVSLHARAGARLSRRHGQVGFLAREISGEIPALMHGL